MTPSNNIRTVKFWVLYDTLSKLVLETKAHKYELPNPSRESRCVVFQVKGTYPRPVGKSEPTS